MKRACFFVISSVAIILMMTSAVVVLGISSCGNRDSKDAAKNENAQNFDSTDLKKDALFAVNIADANMTEIKLGQLAQSYATTVAAKDLGTMMVNDHTKAEAALKAIADSNNIALPDSMSDKSTKKYNDLAAMRGMDFDKAFANIMVDDHKDAITAFQTEADKGNIDVLKNWASKTLPTLQHHLDMSDSVKTLLNK
jgi:putative membrane protein